MALKRKPPWLVPTSSRGGLASRNLFGSSTRDELKPRARTLLTLIRTSVFCNHGESIPTRKHPGRRAEGHVQQGLYWRRGARNRRGGLRAARLIHQSFPLQGGLRARGPRPLFPPPQRFGRPSVGR